MILWLPMNRLIPPLLLLNACVGFSRSSAVSAQALPQSAAPLVTICHYEAEPSGHLWQSLDVTEAEAEAHRKHLADHPGNCTGNEIVPKTKIAKE